MRAKFIAAALLAALISIGSGVAVAADDPDNDAQTTPPAKREFRPFRKILTLMPASWGGPLLETRESFERFIRGHDRGDEAKFETPPVPTSVFPKASDTDLTLSNEFFFQPITGGTTLYSIEKPGFSGRIVWGTDYRASTLNALNAGIDVNPDLADPTMSYYSWSAATLRLEDAYDAYQMAPSAIYLSVRF